MSIILKNTSVLFSSLAPPASTHQNDTLSVGINDLTAIKPTDLVHEEMFYALAQLVMTFPKSLVENLKKGGEIILTLKKHPTRLRHILTLSRTAPPTDS